MSLALRHTEKTSPMTPTELKAAREALGLSGARLAKALEVYERTVWRWEAGTAPIPRAVVILMELAPRIAAVRKALGAEAQARPASRGA
jgi:DNA-binding transcriptional regulator YiaG